MLRQKQSCDTFFLNITHLFFTPLDSIIIKITKWRNEHMQGRMKNKLGRISISPEVIAQYAGATAIECFGIVGMAAVGMADGIVRLLKGNSLTRGIKVGIDDANKISLDFHVIIAYGVSIMTVADNLIENVKYKVTETTGMEIKKINVYVEGVRVID